MMNVDLFDSPTVVGLKVKLDRPIDRERPCCRNVCTIGAGKGPHEGELICANCGQHRGWLSKTTAQWIEHVATRFGAPEIITARFGAQIITVHKAHALPEPVSESERRQRIELINRRIAAEGFAPKDFFLTQAPPPEETSALARWYRGARVSDLSASDLHDLVHVRIVLETFAARLAIERLDDATLQAMEEQVERARAAGRRVDLQSNLDLGLEFHDLLVAACGNRKVMQVYENLRRHQTRYQHFAFAHLGRDTRALDEHAEMVAALRRRDLAAVEGLLSAHLLRFYGEIAPLLPVDAGGGPEAR